MSRVARVLLWSVLLLIAVPILVGGLSNWARGWPASWSTADWSSTGTLPEAAADSEAVVRLYAARSGRWKGIFAVHHWLVVKRQGASEYTRYDVVGWGSPVRRDGYAPDARWYGNDPLVVHEVRGAGAEALIPRLEAAIAAYSWAGRGAYRVWPGPNSNTFVAFVLRQVPELGAEMLPTGIGKDYLGPGLQWGPTPSGTGYQVSLSGLLGAAIGSAEGFEFHLLGATIGIDPGDVAIDLPALGTLGLGGIARRGE